jgi:hypothetical protein
MGSGLDGLGKMRRERHTWMYTHGASLGRLRGVCIIIGQNIKQDLERRKGRWVGSTQKGFLCVETKWRLLPSSLRGFIWESAVFGAGERLVHGSGEQCTVQAS